ncbi:MULTISPECIES: DUF4346 domain-containing protein [Methylomonas]|uniref:Tetrahydromethanopterin S-methyltransferase subunit A n=1 Tax=Methylomonas methanica TaxID=421 RepID=A0ABY2CQF4_METMH|nr:MULTISPECIES: DUF4346 domain-containing protein [Methylomonas]TCV86159.1 tetrahydromethanopterin S-methyltransferase subunit A [Methylomonas methanica]
MTTVEQDASALRVITEQIEEAIAAPKCHKCGCFQQTVEAFAETEAGRSKLAPILAQARTVFLPKKYDCLGCPVCYPAIAANAFAEAYPEAGASLDLCPTEESEERIGWPPLPGNYRVLRFQAPVAVCALNSDPLVEELAGTKAAELSIVGSLHTENLGIEHLIRNVLSNPHIRFLIVCGEDTRQAIGHLPGQSLVSLMQHGVNEKMRIVGAQGKRPLLKNLSVEHIDAFRRQVELIDVIGESNKEAILDLALQAAHRNPGPFGGPIPDTATIPIESAHEPQRLILDPQGYFVVYPDQAHNRLILEHYTNQGVLDRVFEAQTPAALYATAIEAGLISRLDHAAYLGRELARAEESLRTDLPYVQDRAAGEITLAPTTVPPIKRSCGCGPQEVCNEKS